jgi:phage tail tape-measure protein
MWTEVAIFFKHDEIPETIIDVADDAPLNFNKVMSSLRHCTSFGL